MIVIINNIATEIQCITETVSEELNGPYEYEATMSAYEMSADRLAPNMIVHASNGVSDQMFRIYDVTRDIDGLCTVKAQHISYDLAKIPVAPFSATGAQNALTAVSTNSMVANPFTFTTDLTNQTSVMAFTYPLNVRQILGGVEGSFLDRFHCEFEFDNYSVKVLSQRGEARSVTVNYGESMTDFSQEVNGENYYTGVLVFAIVDETTYQSDIYNLETTDRPFIAIVDVSSRYQEEGATPTKSELNALAQQYATSNHISTLKTTTDVGYIDLANTDQYAGYDYIQPVHIGDTLTVNFQPLGISMSARAYAYTYNCLLQKYDSIKIGDAKATLYSTISSMSSGASYGGGGGGSTTKTVFYGTSTSAGNVQDKIVNTTGGDFTLDTGNILTVQFTNANTYDGPVTLNVDNTGYTTIRLTTNNYDAQYRWDAGEAVSFVYDNGEFVMIDSGKASTSRYGETILSNAIDSTSQTTSATSYAVKQAYDLALQAQGEIPLTYAGSPTAGGIANKTMSIPFGKLDTTSTSTVMTAQIDGITELRDGVCMFLRNDVVTSASGFTINVNGLGAKPVYSTMADATRITTTFNVNYTMLFVYNSSRVSGGCWDMYYGYNSDTTTGRGYNDYYFRPYAGETIYRYKFLMQGLDNRMHPITVTNQASATQVDKTPTSAGLRPWKVWYYSGTGTVNAGSAMPAQALLPATYITTAGYNFNTATGTYKMVYLRGTYDKDTDLFYLYDDGSTPCNSYYIYVPDNTANINLGTYFVQGYYYLLVGGTYSTSNYMSLFSNNPLCYFDGTNLVPVSTKVTKDLVAGTVGVSDVKIYNTSVVDGGVATIPWAKPNTWGVVQVTSASEPGSAYMSITYGVTNSPYDTTLTRTVPILLNGTILPSYVPQATHSTKGGVILTTWTGSITDSIDEVSAEGYDSTVGGIARTVTTDSGDFSLTVGNRVVISGVNMWGYTTNYPHFINIDNTGYKELRFTTSEQVRSTKYEAIITGTIEVVYDGTYFIIVNGFSFKRPQTSKASSTEAGVVKVGYQDDPRGRLVWIQTSAGDYYMPAIGFKSTQSSTPTMTTIMPSYLPTATSTTQGAVVVDSALSDTSTNPVQNSAVKAYVDAVATTAITTTEIDTITG